MYKYFDILGHNASEWGWEHPPEARGENFWPGEW